MNEEIEKIDKSLFELAEYDSKKAELIGYSNYSYWKSTLQVFMKNKIAVFLLAVVVLLLLFTIVQPYLPNQHSPLTINTDRSIFIDGHEYKVASPGEDEPVKEYLYDVTIEKEVVFIDGEKVLYIDGQEYEIKGPENTVYIDGQEYMYLSVATGKEHKVTVIPGITTPNKPDQVMQVRNVPPGDEFWFGTNSIGQDIWSRIWSGTRTSLFIGLTVGFIELVVGIFIGSIWGYVRKLDAIITEIYNVVTNIPTTIILILTAYIMEPGIITVIIAMSVTRWTSMARFVRNLVLIIRDREYNLASRCLGTPLSRIATKNLLPYLVSVIMLRLALAIPLAIGSEVFLTYIGIGLPVDIPSLGNLINEGRAFIMVPSLRYQLLFPTAVLSIITISFYVMGNAFGDASDPKNHM
jgi:oligopeptide transport system permease protein